MHVGTTAEEDGKKSRLKILVEQLCAIVHQPVSELRIANKGR
jgi:hypothetical protein